MIKLLQATQIRAKITLSLRNTKSFTTLFSVVPTKSNLRSSFFQKTESDSSNSKKKENSFFELSRLSKDVLIVTQRCSVFWFAGYKIPLFVAKTRKLPLALVVAGGLLFGSAFSLYSPLPEEFSLADPSQLWNGHLWKTITSVIVDNSPLYLGILLAVGWAIELQYGRLVFVSSLVISSIAGNAAYASMPSYAPLDMIRSLPSNGIIGGLLGMIAFGILTSSSKPFTKGKLPRELELLMKIMKKKMFKDSLNIGVLSLLTYSLLLFMFAVNGESTSFPIGDKYVVFTYPNINNLLGSLVAGGTLGYALHYQGKLGFSIAAVSLCALSAVLSIYSYNQRFRCWKGNINELEIELNEKQGAVYYKNGDFEKSAKILETINIPLAKMLCALSLSQIRGREEEALKVARDVNSEELIVDYDQILQIVSTELKHQEEKQKKREYNAMFIENAKNFGWVFLDNALVKDLFESTFGKDKTEVNHVLNANELRKNIIVSEKEQFARSQLLYKNIKF